MLRKTAVALAAATCLTLGFLGNSTLLGAPESPPLDVPRTPLRTIEIKNVIYNEAPERPLRLNIIAPQMDPSVKKPAVVYIHGGGWQRGTWHTERNRFLAQRGYLTVSIEYRFSQEAIFPAQIEDAKTAVRWLRAYADIFGIDPNRIGAWGHSAGGFLALLLGTAGGVEDLEGYGGYHPYSSEVQAVISLAGPTDFSQSGARAQRPTSTRSRLIGGPLPEYPDRVARANPITYIDSDDPPFLFIHGAADLTVPFSQSQLMHDALKAQGVSSCLVRVINAGHTFRGLFMRPSRTQINQMVAAFFDRHLRGTNAPSDPGAILLDQYCSEPA